MEDYNKELIIDFSEIWRVLFKDKWIIIIITFLFGIAGLIYGFTAREEFISEGKILPEFKSKNAFGAFAGLAAFAGFDSEAQAGGDAVRPDLYPDVLTTTPFFLDLIDQEFMTKKGKKITLQNLLVDSTKIDKKSTQLLYPKSNQYITYSKLTGNLIKDLRERVTSTSDKKTGVIELKVKMPDPVVAAQVANFSMNYLTNYIINYRLEKQKRDLDFLAQRLAAAKGKYYKNQEQKATYSDQLPLQALRLQTADLQRERIDNEYKISSNFYNTLLQKYEETKLKIQQETPVIKILDPAVVPNLKSEPRKLIILIVSCFVGLTLSIIAILIKNRTIF